MLNLLPNNVSRELLGEFMGYKSNKNDGRYVNGTSMSDSRYDTWVVTVVCTLVETKERGRHQQKEYRDAYARMGHTGTRQSIRNV